MRFSIIVPVYNVERYIDKCMDTLTHQTFEDYEIIVVNDETPDNSMEIVRKYEETFPDKIQVRPMRDFTNTAITVSPPVRENWFPPINGVPFPAHPEKRRTALLLSEPGSIFCFPSTPRDLTTPVLPRSNSCAGPGCVSRLRWHGMLMCREALLLWLPISIRAVTSTD